MAEPSAVPTIGEDLFGDVKPTSEQPEQPLLSKALGALTQAQTQPTPTGAVPQPEQPQTAAKPVPEIKIMSGLDLSPWVKICVYGDGGSGKTVFAAGAPAPLFIDTEKSTNALRDWPKLAARCNIVHIEQWEQIPKLQVLLTEGKILEGRQTIVLDTLDALQRKNLKWVMSPSGGNKSNPWLPQQHNYKQSGNMVLRFVEFLTTLDVHVIVLSHKVDFTPEGSKNVFRRPGVTPLVARVLTDDFDLMAYMVRGDGTVEGVFNGMYTRTDAFTDSKNRFRFLPPQIANPKFSQILDAANHYKQTEQEQQKA